MNNPFKELKRRYQLLIERADYIFLCSHMRGYTSLLSHILGSHNEIKGYSEMHQSYRSNFGLIQLRFKSKLTTKSLNTPRFLYDKLLHNQYKISRSILHQKNVHPILMIREPEQTIKSIINMGEKMHQVSWYTDEKKVTDYYCKRLLQLEQIAKKSKGRIPFILGNQLIDQPESTLNFLSEYLQLNHPLQKDYNTFSLTGTVGLGDPSKHIKSGTIVKNRDKYSHISLSHRHINAAQNQFIKTKTLLASICKTI